MPEKCPYCGKEVENTKALGSHIHYMHSNIYVQEGRSEIDEERFQRLLDGCLSDRGLRRPRATGKIEEAITQIPPGVSPTLDKYRDAFKCALGKEELLGEVEKLIQEEETKEQKGTS